MKTMIRSMYFLGALTMRQGVRSFSVTPSHPMQGVSNNRAASVATTTRTFASREATSQYVGSANPKLMDMLNSQVTNELEASQLYLAASIWCEANEYPGHAAYFKAESDDERTHAMGIIEFAQKRNFNVELEDLEAPETSNWANIQKVWETLLEGEQKNTQNLLELGDVASEVGDHATTAFLMPYHQEQVNEEDNLRKYIATVKDERKTPGLVRQLDDRLGSEAGA